MLLAKLLSLLEGWAPAFRQHRTHSRAIGLALGLLCGLGRRTITRAICFNNRQHQDWGADYKLFNRSRWNARALFGPIIRRAIAQYCPKHIVIGLDDTGVKRSGKKVKTARWLRDPLESALPRQPDLGPAFPAGLAADAPLSSRWRKFTPRATPTL
jgi:hypothetical protein